MLLEQLVEYAEKLPDAVPPGHQRKPVRYIIDLYGEKAHITTLGDGPKSRGLDMVVPHAKRANAIRPQLFADNAAYTLGVVRPQDRPERVVELHSAYREVVEECAVATGDPMVRKVAAFLAALPDSMPELPADFDPSAWITFEAEGVRLIDLPTVQRFWSARMGGDESDGPADETLLHNCIVCNEVRPAVARHPLKIKGILAGQSGGTDLISANNDAFFSYGLENSLIAPTCASCAEKYANGLNALLSGAKTHIRVAGVESCFWVGSGKEIAIVDCFDEPDSDEAKRIIDAPRSGNLRALLADRDPFYAVTLSGNGSRTVVLSWLDSTLGDAYAHVLAYFDAQRIETLDGSDWTPFPLRRLANAMVRDPQKQRPPRGDVAALMRFALDGDKVPLDLLNQAVLRCRAEQGVRRDRAALIKLVLVSREPEKYGGGTMERLDESNHDPGYLCGRLLAILDGIQRAALGNPNTTIIDRFYGSASATPASVFGTLMRGAQPHLAKLRKERPGAYSALNQRLEETIDELKTFPATLTLQQQGLFAIGFYHQRARDRRQARERAAERDAASAADAAGQDENE